MATENSAPKYGDANVRVTEEGGDLVIRCDKNHIYKPQGELMNDTKNGPGATKARPTDLIASTRGFTQVGTFKVSLNVTRV
jgi:hypothetical protein